MKTKILTMAYTRMHLIERSLSSLWSTIPISTEHYVLDQHYPLPSAEHNSDELFSFCLENHNVKLLNAGRNLGYHIGIGWALERMDLADDDVLVVYDPDAMIKLGSEAWLSAMELAFSHDKSLAVVGLNTPVIDQELKDRGYFDESHIGGALTLRFMRAPVQMSIVGWKAGFIRQVGGLKEPRAVYGGVEGAMFPVLCQHQRRWAVLKDFWEDMSLQRQADPEYTEWKYRHGYLGDYAGDFESYLREMGRIK